LTGWNRAKGIGSHTIVALLPDSSGDVWIGEFGNPNLLQRLRDEKVETVKAYGNPGRITAMAEDAAHYVWIGTQHGTLMRAKGETFEIENSSVKDLPPGFILSLFATPDGALWIGYKGGGLGRLKNGRFARVTTSDGLLDDTISEIIADDDGWLWFGSERGIFKVQLADLNNVLDHDNGPLSPITYGPNEGLVSLEAASPDTAPFVLSTPVRSPDGRLWMPMRTAIAVVDPEKTSHENPAPPPVLLTHVLMDGKRIAAYDSSATAGTAGLKALDTPLHLPPNHHRITVGFAAIQFSAPANVHVRYQLEGFDDDWINAGTEREVGYSRIDAGNYRFRLEAQYGNGAWSETSLPIIVAPFFWQTWWFRVLTVVLAAVLAAATARYISFRRLRAKVRKLEQRAALDREKERIARDLHDNLGSRLTKIISLSKMAFRDRATPDQTGIHVQQIGTAAKQVINSLDETVWVLNSRNDNLPNLINYLGQTAVEFLRSADIRCRIDFPDHPPELAVPADVRHNLFLVVQEALNNVVRHAHASEVRLTVTQDQQWFSLVIQDDGRGFENVPVNGGADGLRNMRRRTEEMGGRFELESRSGAGTRIALVLPLIENT
ncbi:MAG TPA: ATP-binding protein, partial [Desulfuromonadaceae bacterium]|nr:ATP-binding protein [Desulfuromonadaceae bacterium]